MLDVGHLLWLLESRVGCVRRSRNRNPTRSWQLRLLLGYDAARLTQPTNAKSPTWPKMKWLFFWWPLIPSRRCD